MQRWFADCYRACRRRRLPVPGGSWSQRTTFGWGVGGNVLLPVWPKFVDLQGSVLYGQGIGRYARVNWLTSSSDRTAILDSRSRPCNSWSALWFIRSRATTSTSIMARSRPRPMPGRSAVCRAAGAMPPSPSALRGELGTGEQQRRHRRLSTPTAPSARPTSSAFGKSRSASGRTSIKAILDGLGSVLQYEYVTLDLFSGASALSLPTALTTARMPGCCQHGPASEQQHRLLLAPLLSVQLSGTGQKLRKAPPAQPAALLAFDRRSTSLADRQDNLGVFQSAKNAFSL